MIACTLHIIIHFINGWYECYRQINTPKVYRYIFHQVMDISEDITIAEYEDPAFFDSYSKALDQCVDKALELLIIFGRFLGNVVATIMTLVIVVSVDPVLMVMVLLPIAISFYFGKKPAGQNTIWNRKQPAISVRRIMLNAYFMRKNMQVSFASII